MTHSRLSEPSVKYFRPRRLGHANLYVEDLDRSMAFYSDVVGLEVVYVRPPVQAGFLSNGNTHHDIGLVGVHGPVGTDAGPGLYHIGLEMETEAELVEGYHRAVADGISFVRTTDHFMARAVYSADPDGTQVEIYADVRKDWREIRKGEIHTPTTHWDPGSIPPSTVANYHADPEIRRIEEAMFHARRCSHVTLVASAYEDCVAYFTDIVGFDCVVGGPKAPFAVFGGTCGEASVTMFRAGNGRAPGMHHVGFSVWDEDDLERSKQRYIAKGGTVKHSVDHPARRAVYITDPDGMLVQLHVDRSSIIEGLRDAGEDVALFLS